MSRHIVIIGGGIIGASTAYYLTHHPALQSTESSVHIVEASYIAAGSSGKGGGFLAEDWHQPYTASLGRLSWRLHQELATQYNGEEKWGYRRLKVLNVEIDAASPPQRHGKSLEGSEWLGKVEDVSVIGDVNSTAQVTPSLLSNLLVDEAKKKGAKVTIALVDGIEFADDDETPKAVLAITDEGVRHRIPATDVIFATGPWTGRLTKCILGDKAGPAAGIGPSECATSIIIRPTSKAQIPPQALFSSIRMPDGRYGSPEVFPRANGTVYISGAGTGDHIPLPDYARDLVAPQSAVNRLLEYLKIISPSRFEDATIEAVQACFRPDPPKGGNPIVGQLSPGLWVASGHNVWGLHHGPGTGKVMSELIFDGRAISADVSALAPSF